MKQKSHSNTSFFTYLRTPSSYFWMLPFFGFLAGYLAMSMSHQTDTVPAPHLIGKSTTDALRVCATEAATMRLLDEKLDESLPEGTIIEQDPAPGTPIKTDGAVWCIVSKKTTRIAPALQGLTREHIAHLTQPAGITCACISVPSTYPVNTCFAQHPLPTTRLNDTHITAYIAQKADAHVIVPSFIDHFLTDVIQFLHEHDCTPEIFYQTPQENNHQCGSCTIIDQQPRPGTIIKTENIKKMHIQLYVRCQT